MIGTKNRVPSWLLGGALAACSSAAPEAEPALSAAPGTSPVGAQSTQAPGSAASGTPSATPSATPQASSSAGPATSSAAAPVSSSPPASSSAAPPAATTASAGAGATCEFSIEHSISEKISTVGIVTWSIAGRSVQSARIEFGLDTNYGLAAPVDLAEEGYRTLLLGMKGDKTYHLHVVAETDQGSCDSGDYTLDTGSIPNAIALPDIQTYDATKLAEGYSLTGRWGTGNGGPSYILDKDNDVVWYYDAPDGDDVFRTNISYDGKRMWTRNTAQGGGGWVRRITLDGLQEEVFDLPETTHDLTVLPDGKVGLITHVEGQCDAIIEFDPETQTTQQIFDVGLAHGKSDCHVNYLAYYAPDDAYYISDWSSSDYIKVKRSGELVWVLNGDGATMTGGNWTRQHGIHVLSSDKVLIFSNEGRDRSSLILEYTLDEQAMTATETWAYDPGIYTGFGGDVQRLENGNTIIAFSSSGVIQQLDPAGELIQELVFPLNNPVGYLVHRDSLYGGPPPKIWGLAGPPAQ